MLKIDHTTSVKESLLLNTNNTVGSFQFHMGLSSERSVRQSLLFFQED